MSKNLLLDDYVDATVCEITMHGSSNSEDSKLVKPTINPEPKLGIQ